MTRKEGLDWEGFWTLIIAAAIFALIGFAALAFAPDFAHAADDSQAVEIGGTAAAATACEWLSFEERIEQFIAELQAREALRRRGLSLCWETCTRGRALIEQANPSGLTPNNPRGAGGGSGLRITPSRCRPLRRAAQQCRPKTEALSLGRAASEGPSVQPALGGGVNKQAIPQGRPCSAARRANLNTPLLLSFLEAAGRRLKPISWRPASTCCFSAVQRGRPLTPAAHFCFGGEEFSPQSHRAGGAGR